MLNEDIRLFFLLICAIIFLSAGFYVSNEIKKSFEEKKALFMKNLPEDCSIKYLGKYYTPDNEKVNIVIVNCGKNDIILTK